MPSRGYFADSGGGDTTTQSATVQTDHRTLTFTGDASSTYLIIGYVESQVDINAARDTQVRLYDDTAAVSVYDTNFECRLTTGVEWRPLTFAYLFTTTGSPVPQTFKLQHKLESTLTNADSVCRNGSLIALKLNSGTDFTATSDSAATATSSPGTWTDYTTSLTFTATSDDYLIIAVARCAYSATTNGARIRMLCEDTTTGVADTEWVPSDSTTKVTYAAMVKRTLTAGSVTFKLQHSRAVAGSGTSTLDFVRYVALRLSDFDSTQVTQDTGADTTTSATYADLGDTHTQTLTSGIDYLMLASANSTIDTTSVTFGLKVTDGTTTFAEPAVSPGVTGKGFAAVVPKIISGSGSSTTHKVQGISNGTATLTLAEHRIAMLQVEAAVANAAAQLATATALNPSVATTILVNAGVASTVITSSDTTVTTVAQASAGVASISVAAYDGHDTVFFTTVLASGTATGNNTTSTASTNTNLATASVAARDATAATTAATNANAGVPSGTVTGNNATVLIAVVASAGVASISVAAYDGHDTVFFTTVLASGTATGNNTTSTASTNTNLATASVAARDATAATTAATNANAGVPSGTVTGNNATVLIAVVASAGVASVTTAAYSATSTIVAIETTATITATAFDGTTTTLTVTNVPAGVASLAVQARDSTTNVGAGQNVATTTALAHTPSDSIRALTGLSSASPIAYDATQVPSSHVYAEATTASPAALGLTGSLQVNAELISGTGVAYDATTVSVPYVYANAGLATANPLGYNASANIIAVEAAYVVPTSYSLSAAVQTATATATVSPIANNIRTYVATTAFVLLGTYNATVDLNTNPLFGTGTGSGIDQTAVVSTRPDSIPVSITAYDGTTDNNLIYSYAYAEAASLTASAANSTTSVASRPDVAVVVSTALPILSRYVSAGAASVTIAAPDGRNAIAMPAGRGTSSPTAYTITAVNTGDHVSALAQPAEVVLGTFNTTTQVGAGITTGQASVQARDSRGSSAVTGAVAQTVITGYAIGWAGGLKPGTGLVNPQPFTPNVLQVLSGDIATVSTIANSIRGSAGASSYPSISLATSYQTRIAGGRRIVTTQFISSLEVVEIVSVIEVTGVMAAVEN